MGDRITDEDHLRLFDVLLEHMAPDWPGLGPVTTPSPPQLGTLMGNVDITLEVELGVGVGVGVGVEVGVTGSVGVTSTTGFLTGPRHPDPQIVTSPAPTPHNYNLFQQQQVCAFIQQHMHPTTQQLQQLRHLQQQQQLHLQLQIHQQQLQQQQHQQQLQQLHQQQQIHQQQLQLQQQRLQHPSQPIPQITNPYPPQHHLPQQLQQQFQQQLQEQLHQQQQQQLQLEKQQLQQEQQPQIQHTQLQPASQPSLQQNDHHTPVYTPNQDQLIQNLVGNWTVPNLTGTYNPFGLRQVQTTDVIQEPTQPEKSSIINTKRTRIVAEVRPMRPSYSAVLTTPSPAPQKPNSPALTNNINNVDNLNTCNSLKAENGRTKGGTSNNASNFNSKQKKHGISGGASGKLRRQHSAGSDEQSSTSSTSNHTSSSTSTPKSTQTNSSQGTRTNRKSTGEGSNNPLALRPNCNKLGSTLARRWVSLDDLDSNGNNDSNVFQHFDTNKQCVTKKVETSPNASRKKSKGHPRNSNQDELSLNNQKASSAGVSSKSLGGMGPGSAKRPIHINNLGTPHWSTTRDMGRETTRETPRETPREIPKTVKNSRGSVEEKRGSCSSYKSENKPSTSGCSSNSSPPPSMVVHISSNNANRSSNRGPADKNSGSQRSRNQRSSRRKDRVTAFVGLLRGYAKLALVVVYWFLHLLSDVLDMSLRLTFHMFAFLWESWILCAAYWLRELVERGVQRLRGTKSKNSSRSGSTNPEGRESVIPGGLTSNISMPSTGDEAMKRLLACKGKDPYSILGVTPTCTDDDVKRYYKRQAFLVHPDKNNQPGAEEAFKILVHAFELIGEPEKRADYDRCVAETQQVEQAWSELGDLLSQLHQKMEYAANTIKCTNCGKRHKRVTIPRKPFAARFCAQCKIKHSAKEGDMWAETKYLGFLWRYYACMDGAVHDITEWAACQADNLRHLKPNSHSVQYRIVLGTQPRQHQHGRGPSEPDLEHFLSSLYNQSGGMGNKSSNTSEGDDAGGAGGCVPSGAPAGSGANGAETTGSSQGGRQRRKGKRNKF